MQGIADRPEAVFVAFDDDEVVGYAKLALAPSEANTAWHDLTGVKRAWRGRGIAAALKRTQIAWAKEQGYRRLVTHNEERNEPIRRLNERHGYRLEPGRIFLRAEISGDSG
jgi:GNAT superfamily N-acetyltransferase